MKPRIVALAVVAALFVVSQWLASCRDHRLEQSVDANCAVLTVLLDARADRDATVDLFESIRARDPELFDRLVARAERGDRKLLHASTDLSCDLPDRIVKKLRDAQAVAPGPRYVLDRDYGSPDAQDAAAQPQP